jgi:hypothetical protein
VDYLNKIYVARTGQGSIHAVGRCVAYTEHPTVQLVLANGEQIHWRADMCELLTEDQTLVEMLVPIQAVQKVGK